jgi:FKBP-type peptidyl-prolyl cis-trans isomerase
MMKMLKCIVLLYLGLSGLQANAQQSPLNSQVQAGFVTDLREAVKLMPSGSKRQVVVPSQLGYGALGSHGVAPSAVLIFSIKILGVN